jgi:hypothetical protein
MHKNHPKVRALGPNPPRYEQCRACYAFKSNRCSHEKVCPVMKDRREQEEGRRAAKHQKQLLQAKPCQAATDSGEGYQLSNFRDSKHFYVNVKAFLMLHDRQKSTATTYCLKLIQFFDYVKSKCPTFVVWKLQTTDYAANLAVLPVTLIGTFCRQAGMKAQKPTMGALTGWCEFVEAFVNTEVNTLPEVVEVKLLKMTRMVRQEIGFVRLRDKKRSEEVFRDNREAQCEREDLIARPNEVLSLLGEFIRSDYLKLMLQLTVANPSMVYRSPIKYRDMLGILIQATTGHRGIAVCKMTYGQWLKRRTFDDGTTVIRVKDHKTSDTYGSLSLVIQPWLLPLMEVFAKEGRSAMIRDQNRDLHEIRFFPNKLPGNDGIYHMNNGLREGTFWMRKALKAAGLKDRKDPDFKTLTTRVFRNAVSHYGKCHSDSKVVGQMSDYQCHTIEARNRHYALEADSSTARFLMGGLHQLLQNPAAPSLPSPGPNQEPIRDG